MLQQFINLTYNDKLSLKKIHKDYKIFLDKNDDILLGNILIILESLIILSETHDFKKAARKVAPIWTQLQKRNTLYFIDLFILSSILFFFPLETALDIRKFAERNINKYKTFQNIHRLKINLSINSMLLLMKDNQFNIALEEAEKAIVLCQEEQMYIHLSVFYIRKGICLSKLNKGGDEWIEKGQNILNVLEQKSLAQLMSNEVLRYK